MHSPDDRSWPVTADGVMDWEAVFEKPETGFVSMIALARSPEALKQTTLVIIRNLFSRKNDESNIETYTALLDEIVPDDAPASDVDAMRAGVIELLRRIKQERQRIAAEYHDSEKDGKDDERPTPEDEKETGDEDPALRIGDPTLAENNEELDKKIDQANFEGHERRRRHIQARKEVHARENKVRREQAKQNARIQRAKDRRRATKKKLAEQKRRRDQFKLLIKSIVRTAYALCSGATNML